MDKININLDGAGKKIGVVLSRFNSNIGDGLLAACHAELLKLGVDAADIRIATVPGYQWNEPRPVTKVSLFNAFQVTTETFIGSWGPLASSPTTRGYRVGMKR